MKKEPLPHFEERTVDDIQHIRNQRDVHQARITAFDKTVTTLKEPPTFNALITVIHPDGVSTMQVANNDELAAALIAAYSDGHGDFGLDTIDHGENGQGLER